jgi:2-keto-4-pentenoate hydratase/2-oxohepta-3-ene-1,7-dioic acid hydratase in catechol pathway
VATKQAEIAFGIGTMLADGKPETAVVVNDRVASLKDIVARHSTPGAIAPAMRDFMPDWERWHGWLRGLDLDPAREDGWRPLDAVKFAPPVPEPNNIFHTYHNYDRPSSTTGRRDPPKAQRVLPDIFLGSRSALSGHRDTVYREHGAVQFDFELEVTAVIGRTAHRVSADKADEYVAGYTIGNDLTMHFGWWKQIRSQTTLNDNLRMKNFPGYTPLGPVVVPRDVVGDAHKLRVRVTQDGVLRQDANTSAMIWTVGELIEYLSWIVPLIPGDLILTGSAEELPLPAGQRRGIKVGQTVVCEVEKLGRLETRVLEQPYRQPHEVTPADQPA